MATKFDPVSITELRRRKRVFSKSTVGQEDQQPKLTDDGRNLRTKSQTVQLNLRVPKKLKSAIHREAQATGLTMAEVMEEAWYAYRELRDES